MKQKNRTPETASPQDGKKAEDLSSLIPDTEELLKEADAAIQAQKKKTRKKVWVGGCCTGHWEWQDE